MLYTFGLHRQPNVKYREASNRLTKYELLYMLRYLGITADIQEVRRGGMSFLSFESRSLNEQELSMLSGSSGIVFLASEENGLLSPCSFQCPDYLPEDLPEVLKYKGKTNPVFTRLMLNVAFSLCSDPPSLTDAG